MVSHVIFYFCIVASISIYLLLIMKKQEDKVNTSLPEHWELSDLLDYVKERLNRKAYSESNLIGSINAAKLYEALHQCSLGGEAERCLVKESIKELLMDELLLTEQDYEKIIPFSNPNVMTAQDCLESLLYVFLLQYEKNAFEKLCYIYGFDMEKKSTEGYYYEISEEEIRFAWQSERCLLTLADKIEIVSQRIYQEIYGFSVCDRFISSEIAVDSVAAGCGGYSEKEREGLKYTGSETIYIMLHGKKIRLSCLKFDNENVLENVVKKLARNHPRTQLSRKNCYLVTGLRNNTRVVVARPPVSEGWCFYVRKFNSIHTCEIYDLLTDRNKESVITLLRLLVKGEQNIVITGEQASGKTTLLKSLVGFIDERYSIRVAESAFETRLREIYPYRNIHAMQEYGQISLEDVLCLFKKTDTDVTICGEINEPSTAKVFIQLSQSGGRFTMCTSHHKTTDKLIHYMRNALLSEAGFHTEEIACDQVVDAIHFDVHMKVDMNGHRFIDRITEVIPDSVQGYRLNKIAMMTEKGYEIIDRIGKQHSEEIQSVLAVTEEEREYLYQSMEEDLAV